MRGYRGRGRVVSLSVGGLSLGRVSPGICHALPSLECRWLFLGLGLSLSVQA
jgi:hypothetical protein